MRNVQLISVYIYTVRNPQFIICIISRISHNFTAVDNIIYCVPIAALDGMNDRRGHCKLRLTSRKHFKPKPKRCSNTVERKTASIPGLNEQFLDCNISLPLSAYTDASVKSVDVLYNRVKSCAIISSGRLA